MHISIFEYDPHWPVQYQEDCRALNKVLSGVTTQIHHIGSTSINGLAGQRHIDILALTPNLKLVYPLVESLGKIKFSPISNEARPQAHPRHLLFQRMAPHSPAILHILEHSDPNAQRMLRFRDYLRKTPEAVKLLSRAKKKLADTFQGELRHYHSKRAVAFQTIDIKALERAEPQLTQLPPCLVEISEDEAIEQVIDNYNFALGWSSLYQKEITPVRLLDVHYNISSVDHPDANRVFSTAFNPEELVTRTNDVASCFREHHKAMSWWCAGGSDTLVKRLHSEGIRYVQSHHLLYQRIGMIELAISDSMKIVKVTDPAQMLTYGRLFRYEGRMLEVMASQCCASYSQGAPIEYLMIYPSHDSLKPTAAIEVCYYAGIVGINRWATRSGSPSLALQHLIEATLLKAYQLGWRHSCLATAESYRQSFLDIGYGQATLIHEHQYRPT